MLLKRLKYKLTSFFPKLMPTGIIGAFKQGEISYKLRNDMLVVIERLNQDIPSIVYQSTISKENFEKLIDSSSLSYYQSRYRNEAKKNKMLKEQIDSLIKINNNIMNEYRDQKLYSNSQTWENAKKKVSSTKKKQDEIKIEIDSIDIRI